MVMPKPRGAGARPPAPRLLCAALRICSLPFLLAFLFFALALLFLALALVDLLLRIARSARGRFGLLPARIRLRRRLRWRRWR
jgi:hypothetical protein